MVQPSTPLGPDQVNVLLLSLLLASWILFAQTAALSAHAYILEDGTELPKSSGPHAEEGG
jgi:hypothetical protein